MSSLAIRDVKVQTAKVEIKVVNVDGKQMSLAMFRQIPVVLHEIVGYPDEELALGFVRYRLNKSGSDIWILYAMEDGLQKAEVRLYVKTFGMGDIQDFIEGKIATLKYGVQGRVLCRHNPEDLLFAHEWFKRTRRMYEEDREFIYSMQSFVDSLPQLYIAI